ncbi:hypothetical protein CB1_000104004 [Camelus ferus]|nr:hypothetical protein CB1_000104004 [Camelus ferus]
MGAPAKERAEQGAQGFLGGTEGSAALGPRNDGDATYGKDHLMVIHNCRMKSGQGLGGWGLHNCGNVRKSLSPCDLHTYKDADSAAPNPPQDANEKTMQVDEELARSPSSTKSPPPRSSIPGPLCFSEGLFSGLECADPGQKEWPRPPVRSGSSAGTCWAPSPTAVSCSSADNRLSNEGLRHSAAKGPALGLSGLLERAVR